MGKYSKKGHIDNGRLLVVILLFMIVAVFCITVWEIVFRTPYTLAPDFVPKEAEQYAETIPGDTGTPTKSEEGGGSVTLAYSNEVTIDLSEETAELYFANPGKSNHDILLQVVIQNEVIIQSNTLMPGYEVKQLKLLPDASRKLSSGEYSGNFLVLYYDLDLGEKAIVNTQIPIRITVKE